MDQQTPQTIKAGRLTKECFSSEQERLEAYTKAMIVSAFVGPQGKTGTTGSDGSDAQAKQYSLQLVRAVNIPVGATNVDTLEDSLVGKIITIDGSKVTDAIDSTKVFGIGLTVAGKVWFTFNSGASTVEDAGFVLNVHELKEVS